MRSHPNGDLCEMPLTASVTLSTNIPARDPREVLERSTTREGFGPAGGPARSMDSPHAIHHADPVTRATHNKPTHANRGGAGAEAPPAPQPRNRLERPLGCPWEPRCELHGGGETDATKR